MTALVYLNDLQIVENTSTPCDDSVNAIDATLDQPRDAIDATLDQPRDVYNSGGTWFPFAGNESNEDHLNSIRDGNNENRLNDVEKAISLAQQMVKEYTVTHTTDPHVKLPGIVVTPLIGRAVLFFNHIPEQHLVIDPLAIHAGLTVAEGHTKWIANYWLGINNELFHDTKVK